MVRRRLLVMLASLLLVLLAVAGYMGWSVYRQIQQYSTPRMPISVGVVTVQQRIWQGPLAEHPVPRLALEQRVHIRGQTVIPQSAISYTLNGNSVYVVVHKSDSNDQPMLVAERRFIDVGEQREGMVVVSQGLAPGDRIVTMGQLHLNNGSVISIASDASRQLLPDNIP